MELASRIAALIVPSPIVNGVPAVGTVMKVGQAKVIVDPVIVSGSKVDAPESMASMVAPVVELPILSPRVGPVMNAFAFELIELATNKTLPLLAMPPTSESAEIPNGAWMLNCP